MQSYTKKGFNQFNPAQVQKDQSDVIIQQNCSYLSAKLVILLYKCHF